MFNFIVIAMQFSLTRVLSAVYIYISPMNDNGKAKVWLINSNTL